MIDELLGDALATLQDHTVSTGLQTLFSSYLTPPQGSSPLRQGPGNDLLTGLALSGLPHLYACSSLLHHDSS